MFRASAAVLLATTSLLASPATAADADGGDECAKLAELNDPIVVIGERGGYDAKDTRSATKTDTPLKDVPQAVSVITAEQIEDQSLRSIADVIYFVPGASFNSGEGNRDTIVLRGNSSTADFFVDGVRDDVQYFRDFYNVDRVEVLKGPNAMIFGRGGGGGVVNRVIKRSVHSDFENFALSGDSEGGFRLTARRQRAARPGSRASASTACTRMATASATMSTSSATASIRPLASRSASGHADRPQLRIFPRPPHRRSRRSVGHRPGSGGRAAEGLRQRLSSAIPTRALPRSMSISASSRSSMNSPTA